MLEKPKTGKEALGNWLDSARERKPPEPSPTQSSEPKTTKNVAREEAIQAAKDLFWNDPINYWKGVFSSNSKPADPAKKVKPYLVAGTGLGVGIGAAMLMKKMRDKAKEEKRRKAKYPSTSDM